MQTILVTGGAGFIGAHTCHMLAGQGHRVIVLDNLSNSREKPLPGTEFHRGDLREPADLEAVFAAHRIDAVVHLAAAIEAGLSVSQPLHFHANNVGGSLNLLQAMARHRVRRIVFSSTAAVFGNPAHLPVSEDAAKQPASPYGRSKLATENAILDLAAAGMLDVVILRYFNAAGAHPDGILGEDHEPETHLIPLALQAAAGQRAELQVFGGDYPTPDGTCIRDYVHVMDLAAAHLLALQHLESRGGAADFNLGNEAGFSVKQVLDAAEAVTGRQIARRIMPRRPGDPAVLVAGNAKARDILGWRPAYPALETMIAHAWAYQRKAV